MVYQRRTGCFAFTPDHHPLNDAAHRFPAVDLIARLVLEHPSLIGDLSYLILENHPIIPPGAPSITERYENINAGEPLSDEQTTLAGLLEQIYDSTSQSQLDARRGAILERMVYHAVGSRKGPDDDVQLNASQLRTLGIRDRWPNGYSVDVAACFPHDQAVEFYACKLHARNMPEDDIDALDELGDYFSRAGCEVETAVCCMEVRDDLDYDDEFYDMLDRYPDVHTYAIDEIANLM